jgi:hypothetical protein
VSSVVHADYYGRLCVLQLGNVPGIPVEFCNVVLAFAQGESQDVLVWRRTPDDDIEIRTRFATPIELEALRALPLGGVYSAGGPDE